jgi:RHS repeat-associated protein
VVERYVYSPYGVLTVYDANWNLRTGSQFAWVYNYQGGRFEVLTSLYNFRNRDYSPSLSRWLQNDPEGFPAGDTNFYRFVGNDPLDSADPSGLKVFLVGRPEPWVKHPLGYHYSIVVVSDDGTQVVTYDGAGPVRDFLKDKEGRWIPQRNLKSSLKRLEQCRNPKTGKLELKTDPSKHIFEVDTGGKSFEEEVRALEYVFQNNIWQLPYNVAGPNSNTYAHALLGLAGFEVKPYETTVEIWQPPPPIPGIRYAPQYQTVQTQTPEGAVGWNYNGYYGVTPQTIPGEFRPTIGSLAPQAGPAFQVPAPPPPPAPTPGGGMWTPGGGFWFGFFHFPDDMA